MKKTYIGQVEPEQLATWKKENPLGIFALTSGDHVAYFKNPSRHDYNCAVDAGDPKKVLAMMEEAANILFLGGSREVLENDTKFLGIKGKLQEKLQGEVADFLDV